MERLQLPDNIHSQVYLVEQGTPETGKNNINAIKPEE